MQEIQARHTLYILRIKVEKTLNKNTVMSKKIENMSHEEGSTK
jgi:hypothetical protein